MKNCLYCVYARWNKTKSGRNHPSGDGFCTFEYKLKPLPSAYYWVPNNPRPLGGFISRKRDLEDHCPYFTYGSADKK